ncbi:RNA polymerase sigma-70 factor [Seonamhaeicola algicola]|uniref:RNA polymerase sigma-70 factor n=1 Tax=Seonamhaeicola algicola TaxID=1719036 RepID=A0A5C7AK20_9FLAO|nr:RNA polymerase sigma-70 factor [Seonamhaeicola algicola]TXE06102.1 RNA polymerase sigma-70 factor [Seonamhaeicola algicola]
MNKDEILFECVKKDNQQALEQLFQKYYFNLCLYAKNYVGSSDLAEEVVADVFFKIWQNRKTLCITTSLKSYLYVATKNLAINVVHKTKVDVLKQQITDVNSNYSHLNTDETLRYNEVKIQIDQIIEALPPQRKIIFKLNRIDGLKYKEIADKLGISVSTVQKQMLEAIKYVSQFESQFITFIIFFCFSFIHV